MAISKSRQAVWFIYDGECPICVSAALAFRIQEKYGELNLLNAREDHDHWLIKEITIRGYDLDEGMIIYDGHFYHGKAAGRFMAEFGENRGLRNRLIQSLFRTDRLAVITYPLVRAIRNLLLRIKGVKPIGNLDRDQH